MSLKLRTLKSSDVGFGAALTALLAYSAETDEAIETSVAAILADVRARGDAAVLDCTRRFDGLDAASVASLEVHASDMRAALVGLPDAQRLALESASERVRDFHQRQLEATGKSWSYRDADGTLLGQKVTPIDRVGVYVPGGKAAYPSSVLMNAIPAKVAGVGEIVMVAPMPGGERNALVLAAAAVAGVDRLFTIGGAQAVGALAYGTATIPAVHKITGPGNAYVASAKRRVFGTVGIDMIAGPSEILVLADGTADPAVIAADLLSQAEHDEEAYALLATDQRALVEAVNVELERQLATLPRAAIARESLRRHGQAFVVEGRAQLAEVANGIAAEHLSLQVADPEELLGHIRHAGAAFIGVSTPEASGDYVAGPSHVLPTGGAVRFGSPLGVHDFVARTSLIRYTPEALKRDEGAICALARLEGLEAHARAVTVRTSSGDRLLRHPAKGAPQD